MKKVGAFVVLFLLLFSVAIVLAAEGDDCESNSDCEPGETCQDSLCIIEETTEEETTATTTSSQQDETEGIEKGFECLEEKAKDCSGLTTQEIALTILATPDNIFDDCVTELKKKRKSNHWNNIKDTSLAILAMKHAGEDTEPSEKWLIAQNRTPTDLIWYLQQDSNEASECHIGYNKNDYTINVATNKKIDSNAGTCLTKAQSDFWLQISPNCFDQEFSIACDKDFIATLLYRNRQSSTLYILEGTESAPGLTGSIELSVKSKCFGSGSCDYESTAWATLALLETGHNVEDYIPYIIAMSDTNEQYLPEAFIYMLTNYEDYATQLISDQKLGNYWEAKQSANNKFYDTALALIALSRSSAEQITKAKSWLLFSQGSTGCWNNKIKDTAIVLWTLSGRAGRTSVGGSVTRCAEADFFCIPEDECVLGEDVGNNYFCGIGKTSCCTDENLKSCSEYEGKQCATDKRCVGDSRKATDALDGDCCTGTCEDRPTETECEENRYTCMETCSDFQEPASSYSCDGEGVCCQPKISDEGGSAWWTWVLLILILIVLGAIGWIKREKLKLFWFKIKTRFKKDKGRGRGPVAPRGPGPRGPPRPGFPPMRKKSYAKKDTAMSETFKKLREMSR